MSVTITIPAERLAGWQRRWAERITPGLLAKAAAGALQALIMRYLQKVARDRHDTANRLGATPTGFWAGSAQAVRLHTHANDAPGATADAPRGAGQAPGPDNPIISDADAKAILETIAWKPPQPLIPSRSNMIAQLASLRTPSKGYRRPNKTDSRLVQRDSAARAGRIGG